jgi:hypothetical protein
MDPLVPHIRFFFFFCCHKPFLFFSQKTLSKGLKCILAPYGLSARLLGYIADDSVEAKLTVREWEQFYPTKLVPHVPHVFVVGVGEANKVKLFYPNSFIYVIMDGVDDLSDDELNYDDIDVDNYDLYDAALVSDSSLNTLNSRDR